MKTELELRCRLRETAWTIILQDIIKNGEWKYPRYHFEEQLHHMFYILVDVLDFNRLPNESLTDFVQRAAK
jgi:hypothetical protein